MLPGRAQIISQCARRDLSNSERASPDRVLSRAAEAFHVGASQQNSCSLISSAPNLPGYAFDAIAAKIADRGRRKIAYRRNGCKTDIARRVSEFRCQNRLCQRVTIGWHLKPKYGRLASARRCMPPEPLEPPHKAEQHMCTSCTSIALMACMDFLDVWTCTM
jgi:hypothetical protein